MAISKKPKKSKYEYVEANQSYRKRVKGPDGKFVALYGKTAGELTAKIRQFKEEMKNRPDPNDPLVNDYIDQWFRLNTGGLTEETQTSYKRVIELHNEGSGDSETEQQQPQDDDVQSEDSTDAPGKIVLDGTPVRWDEFPMPTAETFGLTGEDAIIYNAIAQVYNPKVYADTFSQSPEDVTDLSLPAFEIYEKSKSENGNTIYYGVFYECDYYNLGSDLADLNNPVYSLVKGKSPANLTIDTQGNFVDFEQTPESSNDPYGDIRRVCGPMTELADFLCGETETYSKEPLKVPDLNAEAMVIQYLNYYFCQS